MSTERLPVAAALLALGCKPPDPAPTELDELARFFLAQVHQGEHERIVEGADNLVAWFESSGLEGEGPSGGTLLDLSAAEVEAMEEMTWTPDPEPAAGVYAISATSCSLDLAAEINLVEDQLEVFPDNYAGYERIWQTDPACYEDGSCDAVDWEASIDDSFVMNMGSMSYRYVVKLRRSRDHDDQPAIMMVRSVMPEAATEDLNSAGFDQSYHVGVYVPWEGGTLHFSAMWSYGWVNGMDPDADIWPNQYLGGLLDFEEQLEILCTEGW
jgi:hypothetical protein